MDFTFNARGLAAASCFVLVLASASRASELQLRDEFESERPERWQAKPGEWQVKNGVLQHTSGGDSLYRARIEPAKDVMVEARVRLSEGGRKTFGVALRVVEDSYLLVRHYDLARALELLSYQNGQWTRTGGRSASLSLKRDTWYRFKVTTVGDHVMAKLWPEDASEPDWQLDVVVSNREPGSLALVVHDNSQVEFDWVRATDKADVLSRLRAKLARQEAERKAALAARLSLAAVPESEYCTSSTETRSRTLHVVPHVSYDRYPIAGRLTIKSADAQAVENVTLNDFDLGEVRLDLPEVTKPTKVQVTFETDLKTFQEEFVLLPAQAMSWREYVRNCLDTLIEHGRDHYGDVSSPLFMAVLDADLLGSPERPLSLDALVRLEDRLHRRGERGSNLWYDQGLLRALYRMTMLTGEERYATAADDYVRYFFDHCYKQTAPGQIWLNGMPAWGTHVYWDCYRDQPAGDGDGNGPHEILVYDADWENMYRVHPQGVRRTIEGIWRHHLVDATSGLFNRHDDAQHGCDFAFSGGSFIKAFAFLAEAAKDPEQLHRAKTVANWHWNNRNPETGLTADCPGLKDRYDGQHVFTTVVGPYATALLRVYEFTSDASFRDMAFSYIKSYDRYAWDESRQTYWAMLALNGQPVAEQPKGSGYGAYAPYGHVDVWRTVIYSYEFTLSAAQAAVQAYETSVRDGAPDPQLLEIAVRWGRVVEAAMPPDAGRRWKKELEASMPRLKQTSGGYAEDYGRAISLFVHLYRATNDKRYLEMAEHLAAEAVEKLYHNGIFLGHPAKPYYESTNGVGLLLYALLELDSPNERLDGAL